MGNARIVGAFNQVMKVKMPRRSPMDDSHKHNVQWKEVDIKKRVHVT